MVGPTVVNPTPSEAGLWLLISAGHVLWRKDENAPPSRDQVHTMMLWRQGSLLSPLKNKKNGIPVVAQR